MAGHVLQHPPTYAMTHRPGHVDVLPQCETPEEFIVRTSPRLRVFQHDYVSDDVFESPITTESALASHVQETSDASSRDVVNSASYAATQAVTPDMTPSHEEVHTYSSTSSSDGLSWGTGNETSTLLDLDFASNQSPATPERMDPLLYMPLFEETLSNTHESLHNSPFVEDKQPLVSDASINPKMLLPAASERKIGAPVTSSYVSQEPLAPIKNESESDVCDLDTKTTNSTVTTSAFTSFTPMRLGSAEEFARPSSKCVGSLPRQRSHSPSLDLDDLRPSLEEYNKLSSKEKRQLRNKISARNFRNRRKEYITLLEDQLKERDSVIRHLQDQLSSIRLENHHLQEELRSQRPRTVSAVDVSKFLSVLQRSASSASDLPDINANQNRPVSRSSPKLPSAPLQNAHKDVNSSSYPESSSNAFWSRVNSMSSMTAAVA